MTQNVLMCYPQIYKTAHYKRKSFREHIKGQNYRFKSIVATIVRLHTGHRDTGTPRAGHTPP